MLVLLTGVTAVLLITSNSDAPPPAAPAAQAPEKIEQAVSTPAVPQPAPPPAAVQPPVQGVSPDFAQEDFDSEEDDAQIEKEQVDAALAQLSSPEVAQRVEGAEQLGAYPTKEAEQALTQALIGDSEAEVRNTAAQSLGYVEKPTEATLSALFGALEDQNEDVRGSALSTLEDFMLGSEEGSKRYKKIQSGLQSKVDSRSVPEDTRTAIREILEDQMAPTE